MQSSTRIDPETLPPRADLSPTNWQSDVGNRRHPKRSQPDYAYLSLLVSEIERVLPTLAAPGELVLDISCGARPYLDLLAPGTRSIGLDITDRFGMADVVSDDYLPFTDASFDAAMCTDAFAYFPDPPYIVSELKRVLRPGGRFLMTLDFMYEYDEHRYTGPELTRLFEGWQDVEVIQTGARGVTWARLTNSLVDSALQGLVKAVPPLAPLASLAVLFYLPVNFMGALIEAVESRFRVAGPTVPANLLLTARRPRT
ncbi:MAG: methyltransferase domain-containing protein [Actinomycetota bacterium]|nr:methyltransferase domain-containing protein [Actinomycetota bacterium]